MSDDDRTTRQTPAESPDDWRAIWRTVERQSEIWPRVDKHDEATDRVAILWPIFGPIAHVARNWKALVALIAFLAWLNSPELFALVEGVVKGFAK